jgi:hypothetical protein
VFVAPWPSQLAAKFADVNELADQLVKISADEQHSASPPTKEQISMLISQLGKKGGKLGGKLRLETMTAKERSDAASNAAKARWDK